ncbi:MAG: hypothetical protein IPL55_15330 [Saprospiraceae bacterium]|jgi:hypothetical protein|nr:hypothetical protein [Saprospiraceae bacterium]MBL0026423.1 hypothetical protein [Saprospiraceae bacterium]
MGNKIVNSIFCLALMFVTNELTSQITIYSEQNYTGTSRVIGIIETSTLPFNVKSIRVPEGTLVIMANESGCTGLCQYWRNNPGSGRIIGARGCNITVRRIDASDARLQITIKTGNDGLRGGSTALLRYLVNGSGYRSIRVANNGRSFANNYTFQQEYPITGIRIDQILDMALTFRSSDGSTGLFETTDNWNVDQLLVKYISRSYPDGIFLSRGSGAPLVRFTGSNPEYRIAAINSSCN